MGFPARSFGLIFARSKFWWSCLIARYELLHKSLKIQLKDREEFIANFKKCDIMFVSGVIFDAFWGFQNRFCSCKPCVKVRWQCSDVPPKCKDMSAV